MWPGLESSVIPVPAPSVDTYTILRRLWPPAHVKQALHDESPFAGLDAWIPTSSASKDSFFSATRERDPKRLAGIVYDPRETFVKPATTDEMKALITDAAKIHRLRRK